MAFDEPAAVALLIFPFLSYPFPVSTPCRVLRLLDRWRWVNALRLVRLFVFVVLVAHWTACAWHGMYEWIPGE